MAITLTYGNLPRFEQFVDAFDREILNPGKVYEIRLGRADARDLGSYYADLFAGEHQVGALWKICATVVADASADEPLYETEAALTFVGDILSTLGFEWI